MTTSLQFVRRADGSVELAAEGGEELDEAEHGELEEGEPPNPILPTTNEIFWGALLFLLLWALMKWVLLPPIQRTMDDRSEKMRDDRDEAEQARTQALRLREEYQRDLASAHAESTRILEDARHAADEQRRELVAEAEAEIARMREQAQAEVDAAKAAAFDELKRSVAGLAVDAAERVVQYDIDRATQLPIVEQYVTEVGSRN